MAIKVDLSDIDLASLIEQETQSVRFGGAKGYGEGRTRKASCPWCGGRDRFAVVESSPHHHFYCGIHGGSGCGKSGDAAKFMQLWHNISFTEACKRLGKTPTNDGKPFEPHQPRVHANIDRMPSEQWRLTADFFLRHCQARLWHEKIGKEAREILHQRGYTDDYIRERGYGLYPATSFDKDTARWGITDESVKAVWLPRGIVIPWYVGNDIWKLNIRRPAEDLAEEKKRTGRDGNKYVNVKGGSNPIYRADTITPGQPLVLFEGEINADILAMVLRDAGIDNINVVATGSTGKGRADNWLAKIAKASPILISFDPDGAGAKAADYWQKVLPQALLWPSRGGDLNDMYLAGADIVKWLNKGIKIADTDVAAAQSAPVEVVPPHEPTEEELFMAMPEAMQIAYLETLNSGRLCNDCLNEGIQTVIPDDAEACPLHSSPAAQLPDELPLEVILHQFIGIEGMTVSELIPLSKEAEMKERVEQQYRQAIADEQSTPAYTKRIIRDFTKQPDWENHGYTKDAAGNWRESKKYHADRKAELSGKKQVKPVDTSKASHVPDPGQITYTRADLDAQGINLAEWLQCLDTANVEKRDGKDLYPLVPMNDNVMPISLLRKDNKNIARQALKSMGFVTESVEG